MINKLYRLVAPQQIVREFREEVMTEDTIIVRPMKLSICAADQRYYTGKRGIEALRKKLPMALIHEGVGTVVHDPKGEFLQGDTVVMIPNTPVETDEIIAENYLRSSKFRASGFDGFMQDYVLMRRDRLVRYTDIDHGVASFTELVSVVLHSVDRFQSKSHARRDTIGIWGDGTLGFILSLVLTELYPESEIIVLGKNAEKLKYFSSVARTLLVDKIPKDFSVDHAFEAVGGEFSQHAINQIIDYINPEGTISILGVSENLVGINTRMVLEKGLTLVGSSRSGRSDFENAVGFLESHKSTQNQLRKIVSAEIEVHSIDDMVKAFEHDLTVPFKTVMIWKI